jgi:hypothetical protein
MVRMDDANIIRSTFCAEGVRGGARLFLIDEGNGFLVATRWQNVGRRKRLEDAIALFERTVVGE